MGGGGNDAIGKKVLFCGDGANDMAALQAATIGVTLCDSETSVAAPITSRLQNPYSVVQITLEGRCSLVTAYSLVNFNIMYACIQLGMTIISYSFGLEIGQYVFFLHDVVFAFALDVCIANGPPTQSLCSQRPAQRFLSMETVVNLLLQCVLFFSFQGIAIGVLKSESWYVEYTPGDISNFSDMPSEAWETTILSVIGLGQLMTAAIVASEDHPFRRVWWKNKSMLFAFQAQTLLLILFNFDDHTKFVHWLGFVDYPNLGFSWIIFVILMINLIACLIAKYLSRIAAPRIENYITQWLEKNKERNAIKRMDELRNSMV